MQILYVFGQLGEISVYGKQENHKWTFLHKPKQLTHFCSGFKQGLRTAKEKKINAYWIWVV